MSVNAVQLLLTCPVQCLQECAVRRVRCMLWGCMQRHWMLCAGITARLCCMYMFCTNWQVFLVLFQHHYCT